MIKHLVTSMSIPRTNFLVHFHKYLKLFRSQQKNAENFRGKIESSLRLVLLSKRKIVLWWLSTRHENPFRCRSLIPPCQQLRFSFNAIEDLYGFHKSSRYRMKRKTSRFIALSAFCLPHHWQNALFLLSGFALQHCVRLMCSLQPAHHISPHYTWY